MRALVIDDSEEMRMLLGTDLKELGFDVVEAGDGREALNQIKKGQSIDLALVDIYMPNMDGYEFVCKVRSDRKYRNLRLVMVTGDTEMQQIKKCLGAGADEYLMKPFTQDMIREKLIIVGLLRP